MKILHINTIQEGGAALCAIRICKALEQQGIESKMLFAQGADMPKGIKGAIAEKDKTVHLRSNWLIAKLRHLLMRIPWYWNVEKMQTMLNSDNTERLYVHHPLSEYSNIANHPLVKWADIIHLHWVAEFVDYPSFFKKVHKPIVWTLHDELPALGVMHYESDYIVRPKELEKIDTICKNLKKRSLVKKQDLHIVAISKLMVNTIKKSELLKSFPVTLIPNGVDTDIFQPVTNEPLFISDFVKSLENGTRIFLFSSCLIREKRKGLDRILNAMERVKNTTKQKIALVVIGGLAESEKYPVSAFPIFCTGLINDQHELAKIYSAADYLISASYFETYGQTLTEAMACGCPVISTPTGIAPELIKDFNGVICNDYNSESLADGIEKALLKKYDATRIRQYVKSEYSYDTIVKKYLKLYGQILEKAQ